MTKIIDNSTEKLASALCEELDNKEEIAIASAYFNVKGYGELRAGLVDKPLLFLLGREPTESIKWEEEILRELEENEDDLKYFKLLQDAIAYFSDSQRQIRIAKGPFFHGKAYIGSSPSLREVKNGIGVVGSSNFTYGGLVSNRELNMLNTDRETITELSNWFLEQWNKSEDFKEEFISFFKNYITTRSPYEIIAKALYETYKSNVEITTEKGTLKTLYPHQLLSYRDSSIKLQKYDGVLIADATGLGKSRTAIYLALDAQREGKRVLLIAPKSILETTWKTEMRKTGVYLETISTEKLSSDPEYISSRYPKMNFIIVDEAHFFRTPSTNRYSSLRDFIIKNNAQIVLATATPVNTSLMDIYFLLSLYLKEDCINDIYNQTLKGYFTANQKRWLRHESIDMGPVLERFIVRHSRELAKALDRENKINFPERVLDEDPRSKYSTDLDYQKIDKTLSKMNFAFYELSVDRLSERLKLPDGTLISRTVEAQKRESLKRLIKAIVVINLFKRLESSTEAFKTSLKNLDDYILNSTEYARENGYFVPPALKGDLIYGLRDEDEEDYIGNLIAPEELFSKPKYSSIINKLKMTKEEIDDYEKRCREDRETISELIEIIPQKDRKLISFKSRLMDIVEQIIPESSNGVLIFSQYTTTANYIYEKLRGENPGLRIMLATGTISRDKNGASRNKTDIIIDFQRSGGILVSTDVLSAGQNLQNAQFVVNYDFPWNPVVIIQRIGRVDRMGSDHKRVYVTNILPKNGDPEDPKSLEYFIGLMTKIYMRLEAIRETIGLDSSTFGEEAEPKDFGVQQAIAKNDPTILDSLSKSLEQFTKSPMDSLADIMNERGIEWLKSLPSGIGAYKQGEYEGLFVLFTDGEEFHWRLKNYDKKETTISHSEIIDTIFQGENRNSGDLIDYEDLINRLKEMKRELKKELESIRKRKKTIEGTVPRATSIIRGIYDELAKSGEDGEKLAIAFRKEASRQSVVRSLQQAKKAGNLVERARELLQGKEEPHIELEEEKEIKLKRVCWCWIHPSRARS